VERELAKNTTLEVNYIGTKATHLLDRHNIAQPYQIPAASRAFCRRRTQSPAATSTSPRLLHGESRLPYPNFNGFYINSDFHGYSHYNAANVKFEHRAGDMAVTAVFTWARSLTTNPRQRAWARLIPAANFLPRPNAIDTHSSRQIR